jgi:hypothetical protein
MQNSLATVIGDHATVVAAVTTARRQLKQVRQPFFLVPPLTLFLKKSPCLSFFTLADI